MNTQQVADKLIAYCREGKNLEAIDELYSDNITSVEPKGSPEEVIEGKAGIIAKNQGWFAMVEELHSATITDAIVSGNFFTCAMHRDVTLKEHGRMEMHQIAVYEVKDGKVVNEQFFYNRVF